MTEALETIVIDEVQEGTGNVEILDEVIQHLKDGNVDMADEAVRQLHTDYGGMSSMRDVLSWKRGVHPDLIELFEQLRYRAKKAGDPFLSRKIILDIKDEEAVAEVTG